MTTGVYLLISHRFILTSTTLNHQNLTSCFQDEWCMVLGNCHPNTIKHLSQNQLFKRNNFLETASMISKTESILFCQKSVSKRVPKTHPLPFSGSMPSFRCKFSACADRFAASQVLKLTPEAFAFCHKGGVDEGSQTWSHFQAWRLPPTRPRILGLVNVDTMILGLVKYLKVIESS